MRLDWRHPLYLDRRELRRAMELKFQGCGVENKYGDQRRGRKVDEAARCPDDFGDSGCTADCAIYSVTQTGIGKTGLLISAEVDRGRLV
ncbi:hypothetical protein ACOME3_008366 [Neoechinorhynchus agilis]